MTSSCSQGPSVPSQERNLSPLPRTHGSLGLARERWNLNLAGLPPGVINTIQNVRTPSTNYLYTVVANGKFLKKGGGRDTSFISSALSWMCSVFYRTY